MWPIIIAEELVAARRALAVADIASTLLGADDDERNENLRHTSVDDDEIYFYLLAKGLFRHLANNSSSVVPSDEKIIHMVDKTLLSTVYRSSAPDVDNRTSAFCTAFANEMLNDDSDYIDSVRAAIDSMRNTQVISFLVAEVVNETNFLNILKKHLTELLYDTKSVDSMVKMFKEGSYKTPKLQHFIADIGNGYLGMAEAWISTIYHVLSTGKNSLNYIYKDMREGGLCLNTYVLPLWRPSSLGAIGRRPTYMERSLSRGDIDRAEELQMRDKGFRRDGKEWVRETTPLLPITPAGKGASAVENVAQSILLSKVLGTISKARYTKRLASVQKTLGSSVASPKNKRLK